MERSFVEIWNLSFDDIGLIEGINRSGRVWFAFQLCFFRERARFPSRPGDVHADVLRYLAEQMGATAPDVADFQFGHVTARRHRAAILRHLGIRRATDRDRQALRDELAELFRGSFGKIDDQIELGCRRCRARGFFVPSDKIMERLVRGARHDAVENLLMRCSSVELVPLCISERFDLHTDRPDMPSLDVSIIWERLAATPCSKVLP